MLGLPEIRETKTYIESGSVATSLQTGRRVRRHPCIHVSMRGREGTAAALQGPFRERPRPALAADYIHNKTAERDKTRSCWRSTEGNISQFPVRRRLMLRFFQKQNIYIKKYPYTTTYIKSNGILRAPGSSTHLPR